MCDAAGSESDEERGRALRHLYSTAAPAALKKAVDGNNHFRTCSATARNRSSAMVSRYTARHVRDFVAHDEIDGGLIFRFVGHGAEGVAQGVEIAVSVDAELVEELPRFLGDGALARFPSPTSPYFVRNTRSACSSFFGSGRLASASRKAATVSGQSGQRRAMPVFGRG